MTRRDSQLAVLFDRVVLGHPWAVVVCILLGVAWLGFQARHFRLDASAETLVLGNDDLRYWREVSARYGGDDIVMLAFTPKGDLFSDRTLSALGRLRDDLERLERVSSVRTILDVPLLESPPLTLAALKRDLPTLRSPTTDRSAAPDELRRSPLYRELLLSGDARTAALVVSFAPDPVYDELVERRDALRQQRVAGTLGPAGQAELRRVTRQFERHRDVYTQQRHQDIAAIRATMDRYRGEAELFLGGARMVADDMVTFIKHDLKVFGLGAAGALAVMLGLVFRRVRWVCLPMLCCAVSAVSVVGLLGWLGWRVTAISANFISLQLILTMAVVVHLVVRYRERFEQHPDAPHRELILDTVRLKLRPCVYATLTTMAGFGSLLVCDILPVIMLGRMMLVGLTVSLVATFLLFPAVLVLLPKGRPPGAGTGRRPLTAWAARLTEAHAVGIVAASVVVLAAGLVGTARLQVENCFIDYFHPTTEIYQGMKVIDRRLGGTTPLDVLVQFDPPRAPVTPAAAAGDDEFADFDDLDQAAAQDKYWFTRDKMDRIKAAHAYLQRLPHAGKVLSLANTLYVAEKLNGGDPLDTFELALLYSETPEAFKATLVRPYVSVEHHEVRFSVRVRDSDRSLRRGALLARIQSELPGVLGLGPDRVRLGGLLVLYNHMLQSLYRSQMRTLGITLGVLAAAFLILFRSWRLALISMLPNVLPVAVVLGVMGWFGMPLDMMTITIAAIGVGIAVDNTIHYLDRFRDEFPGDRAYVPAMHRCHGSVGRAMYYTSVTITLGLCILALSNFVPTVRFGLLTALALGVALAADLTLLPALLILTKPFGKEG